MFALIFYLHVVKQNTFTLLLTAQNLVRKQLLFLRCCRYKGSGQEFPSGHLLGHQNQSCHIITKLNNYITNQRILVGENKYRATGHSQNCIMATLTAIISFQLPLLIRARKYLPLRRTRGCSGVSQRQNEDKKTDPKRKRQPRKKERSDAHFSREQFEKLQKSEGKKFQF
jgi:hypothetical protein